jgi:formylglycine-generating enzyme required for sulfatase activity
MAQLSRSIPLLCILTALAPAQDADKAILPIRIDQRVALVIGNADYRAQPPIPQSLNDAKDVSQTLQALGFQVTLITNAQIGDLDRKLEAFYKTIQPGSLALFYYSGHGGSLGEENYLLPVEYQQQETEIGVTRNAVAVSGIRNRMEAKGARVRLLVFDACRSASLLAAKDGAAGWVEMRGKAEGTLIAYASAHGQVSRYNPSARNSYYTAALLERLRDPKSDVRTMLEETADTVYLRTGESQMPYLYGRLFGKLYLGTVPSARNLDQDLYDAAKDSRDPAVLERAAGQVQDARMAEVLRTRVKVLRESAASASAPPPTAPKNGVKDEGRTLGASESAEPSTPKKGLFGQIRDIFGPSPGEARTNAKDGLTYVWIPRGKFTMGCSPGDLECPDDEKPAREVTIENGYWMGQTEVTQAAYQRVMGKNPSHFKGPNLPVETIDWQEAGEYCGKVGLRLPTAAEWEYAARAGNVTARYGPVDEVAWYDKNSDQKTHEVGKKTPNAWGLYDMLGNVAEWTSDAYPGTPWKAVRGGVWNAPSRYVRASVRLGGVPAYRNSDFGFRCVGDTLP